MPPSAARTSTASTAWASPEVSDAGADAGCQGGVVPPTGRACRDRPRARRASLPGDPPSCLEPCEYHPAPGAFAPVLDLLRGAIPSTPQTPTT